MELMHSVHSCTTFHNTMLSKCVYGAVKKAIANAS